MRSVCSEENAEIVPVALTGRDGTQLAVMCTILAGRDGADSHAFNWVEQEGSKRTICMRFKEEGIVSS